MNDKIYYHYTTIEACYSIISNKSLWATDYRFLNDKGELVECINSFIEKCPKDLREAINLAIIWHIDYYFHCVVSLSKSPKILSQWKAYSSDAQGVAIGFSGKFLKYADLKISDCIYNDQDIYLDNIIEKYAVLLLETKNAFKELVALNSFWDWVNNNKEKFDMLINDLMLVKNPAFSEEQEVRAIRSLNKDEIKFRTTGKLIIPYYNAKCFNQEWEKDSTFPIIREIWLGPKCDKRNELSIKQLSSYITIIKNFDCGYV